MNFLPHKTSIALAVMASLAQSSVVAAADGEASSPLPVQVALQHVEIRGSSSNGEYRATESSTFTKTDTPLKEIPASITVVPAPVMKDQAMQSLADVIRYVPGALAHQGEGNRDEFIFRGIGSSANLYVDGIRDDAQVFRDLYNLERVEVLKGAAGMIFGRGAGGILNRVTKTPVLGHVGEATFTVGSHDQFRGSVDVGGAFGGEGAASVLWRLNAMGEQAGSFRQGVNLQRHAINPTLTWRPDAATALTVGMEHLRDERTADRGVPSFNGRPLEVNVSTFFGNAEQSRARSNVDSAYAILERDFGGVQLKNTLRLTNYDKFYQNVFPATAVPVSTAGMVTLNAYNNQNQRTNTFNQTDITSQWRMGGVEHRWLVGMELGHQDSTNQRTTGFFGTAGASTSTLVPIDQPRATVILFRPNGTDANNRVKANIAAVYLQDQVTLSPQWKLIGGLRYDHFQANLDDRRTTLTANTTPTRPTDLARTDRAFSPRLGVVWSPASNASYYVSYSNSFLPSAETLSLTVLNRSTSISTADFEPENARNYELGAHWDLAPRLTLSGAIFRLDRNHVRNADGNGGFIQSGQQRTQGLELGLQGEVTKDWKVYAGYAHLDAQITRATAAAATLGHVPALVPKDTLSVWNRVALSAAWGAGLGVVHQGASFPNVDNAVKLPGFTRADGALFYALDGGHAHMALNVENLLDRKYFPTSDANNNISVGSPRTARLTVRTLF